MLANLPVEIILLICKYPELKDLGQLAWTNKRMMQIIKKYRPIVLVLDRKIPFYMLYSDGPTWEGRICLFDSHTNSVKQIARFSAWLRSYQVDIAKDKIFAITGQFKLFEIYDLNTGQISKGPDPPEWRDVASVVYFKDKLYYLGGYYFETKKDTTRVDILIDEKWETGPALPFPLKHAQAITSNAILYALGVWSNYIIIYRLSNDEREWIKVEVIPNYRYYLGVASLNKELYITGGTRYYSEFGVLKLCLGFDPSAPFRRRIFQIADMNYARYGHPLIADNGKLYAIGGFQKDYLNKFCDSIEEYNPRTNKWREVGKSYCHTILFHCFYSNNGKYEGRICLFKPFTCSVEEIAKFHNYYWPYEVATTQDKIFGISSFGKSFEIFDLSTRQISRGPDPPEWRQSASVTYYKDKLYYLGGKDPETRENTNRVDVLIDGKWQTGPALPLPTSGAQPITCDEILYVIGGWNSNKVYRLSDDEQEWLEIGELPEMRTHFGVASLNEEIYITGGWNNEVFKSCLCFDPSAPVDSRMSEIADMKYKRYRHSLIVANKSLYAIGGIIQLNGELVSCSQIEEYDLLTDKWTVVGKIDFKNLQ